MQGNEPKGYTGNNAHSEIVSPKQHLKSMAHGVRDGAKNANGTGSFCSCISALPVVESRQ